MVKVLMLWVFVLKKLVENIEKRKCDQSIMIRDRRSIQEFFLTNILA